MTIIKMSMTGKMNREGVGGVRFPDNRKDKNITTKERDISTKMKHSGIPVNTTMDSILGNIVNSSVDEFEEFVE